MKLTFTPKIFRTITRYDVSNRRGDILGFINYYAKWKCWVWEQAPDIIMSKDCLTQIIEQLYLLDNFEKMPNSDIWIPKQYKGPYLFEGAEDEQ